MGLEQKIGFDRVRDLICAKCDTQYAVDKTLAEEVSCDANQIGLRLHLVDEMHLICMFEDDFPSSGYYDTKPFLVRLTSESSYIDLPSLVILRSSLDTLRAILHFFNGCKDDLYPYLRSLASSVSYFPEISLRIGMILDKDGQVKDNASAELLAIRTTLREKEGAISKRVTALLKKAQSEGIVADDVSVSMRDGHILIPVLSANKRKIPGIVYDESASGKTSFVEPLEVVELNNRVRELKFEEQREILRILLDFTAFIRPYLSGLISASEFIGEIDFIRAKARVSLDMIAGLPIFSEDGGLVLRKARHPLLEASLRKDGKQIVPLNVTLTKDRHILLISGPNAGGKSVCLKTVGLLQYMFQWGMLIPTSEISEMTVFDRMFIDIGDDQSIDNDLSTYSSHLNNLKDILKRATSSSLVLIDEFGSGTEPAAGGAIAEAVLAELDRRGCYGVITTHYTNLKLYANGSSGVVNGAMLFDASAIKPLFILEQGLPGNSFAFELARNIGLPDAIIKDAEERAGSEFVNIERNLRKIARNRRALDEKLARIKTTDKTLESLTDKYQKELEDIKALKKSIVDEAKREAGEILQQANRQVEQTIRNIKEAQAEKEKTKEARRELESLKEHLKKEEESEMDRKIALKMEQIASRKERERLRKEKRGEVTAVPQKEKAVDRPLAVGDKVRFKDSDMVGEIVRLDSKTVSVAVGSIISRLAPDKVVMISNQEYRQRSKPSRSIISVDTAAISARRLNFSPSIDIRGERLTSAMDIITHYIDDAIMVGIGQVKILHGKGNGVLRQEIRAYLRTVPSVTSIADEALEMGGAGITVVKFDI